MPLCDEIHGKPPRVPFLYFCRIRLPRLRTRHVPIMRLARRCWERISALKTLICYCLFIFRRIPAVFCANFKTVHVLRLNLYLQTIIF